MKIFENKVFIKMNISKISWEKIYTLQEMKLKFSDMFLSLQLLYPQQLGSFNVFDLIFNDLDLVFAKIKRNNSLLPSINGFDNIIEFKDGVFFMDQKKFFYFHEILEINELKTVFYIECLYADLNLADFWFNFFSEKINEKFIKDLNFQIKKRK